MLDLVEGQVDAAKARGRIDFTNAPRFRWTDLHSIVGPMLPSDLIVVGGSTGNGKTAFLMSQMDYFESQRVATLYCPLEIDPEVLRRRWAAWKLGYDPAAIARNDWAKLPRDAQQLHERALDEQKQNPFVHFTPDRRMTLKRLAYRTQKAKEEAGVEAVMVDHFHRLDFGGGGDYRVRAIEFSRDMKDLAREHGVSIIAAAQLNRVSGEREDLDRYYPPTLGRLKESSGLGEEADVVLMVSRKLRSVVKHDAMAEIQAGIRSIEEFEMPNTMMVTCRKYRLEGSPVNKKALLYVDKGRVIDPPPSWHILP